MDADKQVRSDSELLRVVQSYLWRKNCNQPEEHGNEVRNSAWLNILSHLTDLKDPSKFRAWSTTIVINEAKRHLTTCINNQNTSVELAEESLLPAARITDYYTSRDAAIDAARMLEFAEKISPEFSEVFRLYNVEELGFEEIALRLGQHKERLRTLYYRGLREVKAKFKLKKDSDVCDEVG